MRSGGARGDGGVTPRARVLLIDNHDSFSCNLEHALVLAGAHCQLIRDGERNASELLALPWSGIVLSAGPCSPRETKTSLPLVQRLLEAQRRLPVLGICLGHQCLAAAVGMTIGRAKQPMHGQSCVIRHDGGGIFRDLPPSMVAARYNSLSVNAAEIKAPLLATAWDEAGELMGLRHRSLPLETVQFHPESHLTVGGHQLFVNWVKSLADSGDSQ